jgi:MraZ protein
VSVQRFYSTFEGTLDGKGRVCIPASYRQILIAQETGGVFVCPSLFSTSLDGFGQALMDLQCAELDKLSAFLSQRHENLSSLVSDSQLLTIDENGRVRLPDEFIASATLKDRVKFVGVGQKFEIWNAEAYAAVRLQRREGMRAARELDVPVDGTGEVS